jgi:hypothetical protein
MRRALPRVLALIAALAALLALPRTAEPIPAFAREYGVSCSLCHAPPPRLTPFGERFAANGFRMSPDEAPRDTVDTGDPLLRLARGVQLAVRMDAYLSGATRSRSGSTDLDLQTPYGVKLLSAGQVMEDVGYYMYFYLSERGEVAGLEDAYLQFTDVGRSGASVIAGQFQVSDPLFKRELRLPWEDYQAYRVRVGRARADLTYDRGLMAMASPWEGGDLSLQLVAGRGLDAAGPTRLLDRDRRKAVALRASQEAGPLRVGAFAYLGAEREADRTDRIRVWGPDATIAVGNVEVNLQFLRRTDSDPLLAAPASPTTTDAALAEVVWSPGGPGGRLFLSGLVNWVESDRGLLSLRLGEQGDDPPYLRRYRTLSGGAHWLLARNLRLLGEAGWDLDREAARLTTGVVAAW